MGHMQIFLSNPQDTLILVDSLNHYMVETQQLGVKKNHEVIFGVLIEENMDVLCEASLFA